MAAVMLAASAALAAQSQAYMAKHPAIRSVITRIEGHDNAPAVIIPRAGDRLTVSFDEESLESRQLRYRLIHCDPHWHPSQLIESEYIDGFNEAPLDDGTYSRATLTHYVHYRLTVPTDIIPTISGNYLIEIFDDYDTARPTLISIPFGVSEQSVDIAATVSPRTDTDYLGAHQQLSIDIDLDRIWNDRYVADEATNASQNNLYPIMMAMAERAWRGGGTEYFDSLGTNMDRPGTDDFKEFADFERRMLHHKATSLRHIAIPYVKQTNVHWRITDAFPNGGDLSRRFPPETEGPAQSYTYADSVYNTRRATGAGIYLRHVWGPVTIPGFYADPQPDHTAYAFTRVYSPADQTVGLQAETQNYSRSEPDLAPLPGCWDYRHSRIWINGDTVVPPAWQSTHRVRSNEISLTNENAAARRPLLVKLRKGWNDVMIKLPVGSFSTPETRLVKWMFTFVFTTPDGSREADLIYDPDAQAPGKIRPQGK